MVRFCTRCCDKNYIIECGCGCGQVLTIKDNHYRYRTYIRGHFSKIFDQSGDKGNNWHGGKYLNSWGYILKLQKDHHRADPKGYVFEHILEFEKAHSCCVLVWGNIHHIDHNKVNNSQDNLEGMTSKQHTLYHNAHRVYKKWSEESRCRFRSRPRDWHGRLLPVNQ